MRRFFRRVRSILRHNTGHKCEGTYAFTANETLTAHWNVKQYTITFDTDGGSKVAEIKDIYGALVTKPKDPAKTGIP